ncbi:uncharacterized protein LOC141841784 [Curcuma longa]|uniref:uncharacterized protein LOC141841784 n=1 Tax=Curcuma longa TaxID=136217 RepID=UPI003D9DCA1E
MDLGVQKHKVCNRNGAAIAVKGVNAKEATEAEKESLLGSEENGAAAADKRKKRLARQVQWNDRKGNDLVEVLEFEPRKYASIFKSFKAISTQMMSKMDEYMIFISKDTKILFRSVLHDSSDSEDEYLDSCLCTIM